ncbi:MAG: HDOD domain-containing protein [Pseudomonadota bacterium]
MKRINIDKIQPGMILGRDVANREGRRLLSKDMMLTSKEIRILKMWGIPEVIIHQDPAAEISLQPEAATKDDKTARVFLDAWFTNNDCKNPVIKAVYDICLDRHLNDQFELFSVFQADQDLEAFKSYQIRPLEEIRNLLKKDLKLPSLPTIFSEINEASQNPQCSGKDIAGIVSKDTSLSATLLKIVNSAYYGLPEKVESLQYAAMALGTQQLSSLALGITVVDYFKGIANLQMNMESFWRHSIASGIAAKTLASQIKGVNSERVFVSSLLHDIGWLVFLNFCPNECNQVVYKARLLGLNLYQVEPRYFGMTHARFGSLLVKNWNFPDNIASLIDQHHDNFKTLPSKEVAIVYVANWLVDAIGIGFAGEKEMARLSMNAWKALELSESVLASIVKQIDRQVAETIKFFYE